MRNVMLNCGLIGESILPRQIKAQALSIFCSFDRYCNLCVRIYIYILCLLLKFFLKNFISFIYSYLRRFHFSFLKIKLILMNFSFYRQSISFYYYYIIKFYFKEILFYLITNNDFILSETKTHYIKDSCRGHF